MSWGPRRHRRGAARESARRGPISARSWLLTGCLLADGLYTGRTSLLKFRSISLAAMAAFAFTAVGAGSSYAADIVGLITKTETNPFFVKMRQGAEEKAKELGIEL